MKHVISCPRCVRQYAIDPGSRGRTAQCHACKAVFAICIATPAQNEPALTLIHPLMPRVNFLKDACAEFMRNLCDLDRLAGIRWDERTLMAIVRDAFRVPRDVNSERWRECRLNLAMKAAFDRSVGTADRETVGDLIRYFVGYLPGRDADALDMMEGAILGIFEAIERSYDVEVDSPAAPEIPVY